MEMKVWQLICGLVISILIGIWIAKRITHKT